MRKWRCHLAAIVLAFLAPASAGAVTVTFSEFGIPSNTQLQGTNTYFPIGLIFQSAFLFGGVFLAAGTLLEVTQVQAIEPARIAIGFELSVIGAVVLGGTNIFGGEGCFAGTVLGTFFLYFTRQTLIYGGVSPYFQDVIVGGTIIGVIGVDCLLHREHKRMEELR